MEVKVSVIGYLNNKVSVFNTKVEISEPSYKRGLHHDDAVEAAEASGYSGPFLTVGEDDDVSQLESLVAHLKNHDNKVAA
jgi:hypothetical protein